MTTVLSAIRQAVARRPDELAAARAAGQKVIGWIGYLLPEEIIHALGLIPVRLCKGGDARLAELGGHYISTQNCFFLRQCVGLFAEGNDPIIRQFDAVVTDTACLQLHRMASLLRHYFKADVLHLGIPKDPTRPEARRYFAAEIGHLVERLAKIAGTGLDEARLAESIELYEAIRSCQRRLYALVAERKLPWREAFEAVQAGFVLDREGYLSLLQQMLAEVDAGPRTDATKAVRVVLAGSPLADGDTKLIGIAEAAGAEIAGDLLWSGSASLVDLEIGDASLDGLIEGCLDRLPHPGQPAMDVESDRRLPALSDLVHAVGAKGVIYHSLRYCDSFSFKMLCTKDSLKRMGVPLMEAQTDYGAMDTEALKTRIEAFVEMLALRP